MPPALSEMRLAGSRAQAVFRTKQLSEVSLKKKKKGKGQGFLTVYLSIGAKQGLIKSYLMFRVCV